MELSPTRETDQQIYNYANNYITLTISALKEKYSMQRKNKSKRPNPNIAKHWVQLQIR